jgi:hypothetical protein
MSSAFAKVANHTKSPLVTCQYSYKDANNQPFLPRARDKPANGGKTWTPAAAPGVMKTTNAGKARATVKNLLINTHSNNKKQIQTDEMERAVAALLPRIAHPPRPARTGGSVRQT